MALKKNKIGIPKDVRASLWFADPKKLDLEKNRRLVITQVLNRGTWQAVRWVLRYYGLRSIRQTVSNPGRGLWFPQTLRFWEIFLNIRIDNKTFQKALFRLDPV